MKRSALMILSCLAWLSGFADVVHVVERTKADGAITQISDRTFTTGRNCTALTAPAKSGYIFTHWEISTAQAFENRDEWGRALDQVSFVVYEDTTLTACYVPMALDDDGDGVADGHELYWYGNLSQGPMSDTDDDGITFAEELARGTNPIMAESADAGPIAFWRQIRDVRESHRQAPRQATVQGPLD